jgi:hypothetical protein
MPYLQGRPGSPGSPGRPLHPARPASPRPSRLTAALPAARPVAQLHRNSAPPPPQLRVPLAPEPGIGPFSGSDTSRPRPCFTPRKSGPASSESIGQCREQRPHVPRAPHLPPPQAAAETPAGPREHACGRCARVPLRRVGHGLRGHRRCCEDRGRGGSVDPP